MTDFKLKKVTESDNKKFSSSSTNGKSPLEPDGNLGNLLSGKKSSFDISPSAKEALTVQALNQLNDLGYSSIFGNLVPPPELELNISNQNYTKTKTDKTDEDTKKASAQKKPTQKTIHHKSTHHKSVKHIEKDAKQETASKTVNQPEVHNDKKSPAVQAKKVEPKIAEESKAEPQKADASPSPKKDPYSISKTVDGKTSQLLIYDTDGDGFDNNDKIVFKGKASDFTPEEINKYIDNKGYKSDDTRSTNLAELKVEADGQTIKPDSNKEYSLGSLKSILTPKTSSSTTTSSSNGTSTTNSSSGTNTKDSSSVPNYQAIADISKPGIVGSYIGGMLGDGNMMPYITRQTNLIDSILDGAYGTGSTTQANYNSTSLSSGSNQQTDSSSKKLSFADQNDGSSAESSASSKSKTDVSKESDGSDGSSGSSQKSRVKASNDGANDTPNNPTGINRASKSKNAKKPVKKTAKKQDPVEDKPKDDEQYLSNTELAHKAKEKAAAKALNDRKALYIRVQKAKIASIQKEMAKSKSKYYENRNIEKLQKCINQMNEVKTEKDFERLSSGGMEILPIIPFTNNLEESKKLYKDVLTNRIQRIQIDMKAIKSSSNDQTMLYYRERNIKALQNDLKRMESAKTPEEFERLSSSGNGILPLF